MKVIDLLLCAAPCFVIVCSAVESTVHAYIYIYVLVYALYIYIEHMQLESNYHVHHFCHPRICCVPRATEQSPDPSGAAPPGAGPRSSEVTRPACSLVVRLRLLPSAPLVPGVFLADAWPLLPRPGDLPHETTAAPAPSYTVIIVL